MTASIYSHIFPNGLVLVAEPRMSLKSAAFTFLTPAGCVYDPADRGGLSGFTCEMTLRGAGSRDSRQFILDLDNLGVERSESVSNAHTSYSGATLAENLPAALSIYADVLRSAHLPDDQLEAGRLGMLQELHAVEDEPAQKVMLELRRRHYPLPWGRPPQGEEKALSATSLDDIRDYYRRHFQPNGTILGVAGRVEWESLKDLVGELLGRLDARRDAADRRADCRRPLQASVLRIEPNANRHRLFQRALSASRLFSGLGSGGRAERRHERPAVHRSSRAPRTVLQRLCHRTTRCDIAAACFAMPAPAPSGPKKRSTSRWANLSAWPRASKTTNSTG